MKPDYELKAKVLLNGLTKKVNHLDKLRYLNEPYYDLLEDIYNNYPLNEIKESRRVNNASYARVRRLRERIETYLNSGQCIWLTLTFNDDTLAKTSKETRRRYVARFLKGQCSDYIANIDYGKENEREHYHAVVVSDFINVKLWKYGFTFTERIKNHITTPLKLSKYVSKLTNHAIKETTKRQCYIYSR